jgi:hypothetical protein
VDRGRRTQRGEREPGSVAAAIPGGPCPGLRVFRCVERRARLRPPGGRNTHVGDGQLVECRHGRRDRPVRTDTAMRSQMTRCKADSPFSPTTQIGPTIPDSAGFQPSTGRPTEPGPGAPPLHHRQRIALAVGEKLSPQLSSFLGSPETARGRTCSSAGASRSTNRWSAPTCSFIAYWSAWRCR